MGTVRKHLRTEKKFGGPEDRRKLMGSLCGKN